ncbi:MAG: GNAT family N-acetyltransferase [Pseudogulbenkiania sp.]|nr:GNAT family N-acetyltransferase [Pseudogulbenkiania sp.]
MRVQVQPLNSATHSRKGFDCGNPQINNWLETMASQQQEKGFSRTFVAVDLSDPSRILGFYSLSSSEVNADGFPSRKRLPRLIPVVRLGKLAIANALQEKGLGELLLINALERIRDIAANLGVHAVVVDAKDEHTAAFYEKYGFRRSPADPLMLALPVSSIP